MERRGRARYRPDVWTEGYGLAIRHVWQFFVLCGARVALLPRLAQGQRWMNVRYEDVVNHALQRAQHGVAVAIVVSRVPGR